MALSWGALVAAAEDVAGVVADGVALADDVRAALDDDEDMAVGSDVPDGVAGAVVGVLVPGAGVDDDGAGFCEPAFVRSPTVVPLELEPVTMADTGFWPMSSTPVTITIAATKTAAAPAARRT